MYATLVGSFCIKLIVLLSIFDQTHLITTNNCLKNSERFKKNGITDSNFELELLSLLFVVFKKLPL